MISILKPCEKEIKELPELVREALADALALLDEGINLSMPLSRPMPTIGKSVHGLRLKDRAGIYRIIYYIKKHSDIWLIHSFQKKSQQTPKENIELAKQRIKGIL